MADESAEVRIVPAEPSDAQPLVSFLRQASQESDAVMIVNLQELTAATEAEQLRAIQRSDRCEVVVARYGQQIIGVATIMSVLGQQLTGELGILVGKSFWHQGVGTALLDSILDWYQHGSLLTKLVLDVYADNRRAIELYHRFGFVQISRLQTTSKTGVQRPVVHMVYKAQEKS